MKKYMCANCGGGFFSKEMYFDTEYDCDLCSDCYGRAERKNKFKENKMKNFKEIISDGNIYYITPCINNCGIKWLTIDKIDNNKVCSDCLKENK